MLNASGKWLHVTPWGSVHEGDDPPSGSTVLVAPGAHLDDVLVKKYDVSDKLAAPKKGAKAAVPRSSSGEPLVMRSDGRAIAAGVLGDEDEDKVAAMEAAEQEDEEEAKRAKAAEDKEADKSGVTVKATAPEPKAVRLGGDVQDKAVHGPAKAAHEKPRGK
jgi:hypothetical protein